MNTTDLMVGDWVFNTYHKKNIQITPYDFFTHGHLSRGEQYFIGEPKIISGEDFEPIPLIPEILEKNGFTKENTWGGIFTMKYCFYEEGGIKYKELNFDKKIVIEVEFSASDNHIRHINIDCFIENGCAKVYICKAKQKFFVHELQHALKLCGIEKNIEL